MSSFPQDSYLCVGHELAIMVWCDVERVTSVKHALRTRLNPVRGSVPVRENLCSAYSPMTMVQSANEVVSGMKKDWNLVSGAKVAFGMPVSREWLCVATTRRVWLSTAWVIRPRKVPSSGYSMSRRPLRHGRPS